MCRFLSILYKTYDQIFFKYMFNLNSIFLIKLRPIILFIIPTKVPCWRYGTGTTVPVP